MTDKLIEQLNKNQRLETTKSLTLTKIQDRIERYIARHNLTADVKLSEKIIRVAQATQIDPSTRRFIDFIASTKNRQNHYHVIINMGYSLLSGVLLLKLKLALSNGDYRKALERYNGSTDKVPYATGILNSTRNGFRSVSLNYIRPDFSDLIIRDTCEISEDSSFFYRYLEIITL